MYTPDFQRLKNSLEKKLPDRPAVQQPDYHYPFVPPRENLTKSLETWNPDKMLQLHDDGVLDFVNPLGFGYVKDRCHVAGFQPHGMTKLPGDSNSLWSVVHLELVGLVVHEKPVVYVTANLPQMDEVRTAPMRPLNPFELDGLKTLQEGEDFYWRGLGKEGLMMGAIRSMKQCLECHGGTHGDLLGAFSYGLRHD